MDRMMECLPDLKGAEIKVVRHQNPQGVLGCCNQFRNPDNYVEVVKMTDGRKLMIFPARPEVSGEWHTHHPHCVDGDKLVRMWKYMD